MNLLKRLRNLWTLSGVEAEKLSNTPETGGSPLSDTIPQKQAIIIKRTTPVEDFLKQDE